MTDDLIAKPFHGDTIIERGIATPDFQLYLDELTTKVNANTASLQDELTTQESEITSLQSQVDALTAELAAAPDILAWVNFNGDGIISINDNFNVSSIDDDGVGAYTIHFTNALPNANYAVQGIPASSVGRMVMVEAITGGGLPTLKTTSELMIQVRDSNSSPTDCEDISVVIIGSST